MENINPIYGYRLWNIFENRLISPVRTNDSLWPIGKPCEKVCLCQDNIPRFNFEPVNKHTCGLYAHRHLHQCKVRKDEKYPIAVAGKVALWGQITEHEDGYRGEFAYPAELYYVGEKGKSVIQKLAVAYGIECKFAEIHSFIEPIIDADKYHFFIVGNIIVPITHLGIIDKMANIHKLKVISTGEIYCISDNPKNTMLFETHEEAYRAIRKNALSFSKYAKEERRKNIRDVFALRKIRSIVG